uniref:Uncharacterized protein n=1 Tax=Lotharella oceanica TaxID=641309 RepID=A0A7S2TYD6_9EUKA|mmetsp:Transcript_33162/g.61616  ORF Transcript_33162/g.61616 Transcript_33162/m.61616 type:complete len:377 (+) Transcript_33162:2-1132(+)
MNLTIIPYRNDAVYGDILGMVVDHQERAKKKEEEGKPENKNKNKIENKNKKSHKGMKTAEDVKDHLTEVFKENHMQKFMAKIHVFNLTMYDRILFLDNDIIPLHDFTSLFDVPKTPACAPDVASGFVLNTGVLVVDPNRTTYVSMMMDLMRPDPVPWRSASKGDEKVDNDQDFINYFFASSLYVLSPYWNVLISIHHDGLGGGGETSPVTEWGAFVEESGRFIQWMLKFKRNRRMVQMVHMGFPKPTWPQFQKKCAPMNPIDEKTKYAKGWEIPSTWKCPKGEVARPLWWRWYVIDSGEPGLAVLALFKTFWARYSRLIDALCEQRGSGYGGVHPPACKMSALRVLTTDMEMVGRDVMETLLANPKIPTWEETLRR